jgi:Ca2+-transporting ATPase
LRNEVTTNPWVWAALLLCAVLLAVPPYLPPMAEVIQLTPPTPAMWGVIFGMSITPLIVTQAVTQTVMALRGAGNKRRIA